MMSDTNCTADFINMTEDMVVPYYYALQQCPITHGALRELNQHAAKHLSK
jgi:hypothetical protein